MLHNVNNLSSKSTEKLPLSTKNDIHLKLSMRFQLNNVMMAVHFANFDIKALDYPANFAS